MFRNYNFRKYDFSLILMVAVLVFMGIIAIGSATRINSDLGTDSYVKKQIIGFVIGLILMLIVSFIDYHFIGKFYIPIYLVMNGMLLAVLLAGETVNQAKRWIDLGSFSIQPSEFAKLLLIIFLAAVIQKYKEKFNKPWFLLILGVLGIIPVLLVNRQPDLSTSVMIISIFFVSLFMGGLYFRYIIITLIIAVPLMFFGSWYIQQEDQQILEPYQVDRIMALIYPEQAPPEDLLQTNNSKQAIGSGQLSGKGLYQGKLNQYNYLPEPQTDFIFSIIGEEFGLIGCSSVIVMILLLLIKCLWIGKSAKDIQGQIIVGGIVGMIGLQTFVNIGVVTGLLPNTGLPLPFISAGLSSLVTNMIAIGFVLNVSMQRKSSIERRK